MSKHPPCPCHSGKHYADCCQPLHLGQAAPDAERLMRARYSAYALKLPQFILETWHHETRPSKLTIEDLQGIKWLKLAVQSQHQLAADQAEVHFIASYQSAKQKKMQLEEKSLFLCMNGVWMYHGDIKTDAN